MATTLRQPPSSVYCSTRLTLLPPGDFSTLTQDTSTNVYLRTMPDGTKYKFNSSGYQTAVSDRNNNLTSYSYDGSNHLTQIKDMNNQLVTLAYSGGGNVTTIKDPASRTTTLAYDGSGNLTSIKDPDSALSTYAYDASHDMTKLVNPLNNVTTFSYSHTRISSVQGPDGVSESYTPEQLQGLSTSGSAGGV